jgi:transporter family-2 protein
LTEHSLTDAAPQAPGSGEPHRHAHAERSRIPMWVAIVLAVVFGAGVAVQSRVNGQLAAAIDDPYTAALISFGSGLAILLVVLSFWRPGRDGVGRVRDGLRAGRIAWWMVLAASRAPGS